MLTTKETQWHRRHGIPVGILCLLAVVGCDRPQSEDIPRPIAVVVTNVVEIRREIVVTNTVTETVTNIVVEKRVAPSVFSARKTAPYLVSARSLTATQLRKVLSESSARIITCDPGAVAVVEATEKIAKDLRGLVHVLPISPDDKVAVDAGAQVRVVPLSSIDLAVVAESIRALGGEVVQVTSAGNPAVRAKMSYSAIRKLAERGDVRRIERDDK